MRLQLESGWERVGINAWHVLRGKCWMDAPQAQAQEFARTAQMDTFLTLQTKLARAVAQMGTGPLMLTVS